MFGGTASVTTLVATSHVADARSPSTCTIGPAQGPTPAQMALAKLQARDTFKNFFITLIGLRIAPFAWDFARSFFKK
ncbi:BZ3500_MvSof-1268-A1-R1_Chr7-1g09070 [Microbotryum saponariae]|uniref:BZ3500_MvSof-1268-A1-R1_Chr7-1g09070 protein n=1 Tax=Microbotryum saponariae TaxID=289078 RepID=A0A2X0L1P6_9BASI|nr:BZ3501_MvSof-1269-A2-R1_Chr7-1g08774 [Microbotryum saponariae]SDA02733.1 BZ3500_MvSof-1268-A1-R1_Chr7-1g09070 [Microbotryum saponariae]